jgi:hypothetical protein
VNPFDWRAFAARILAWQREPASIVVGKLVADYFLVYKIVTIRRSDGSTYEAAANGQNWELGERKVPMIAHFIVTDGTSVDWSHGMLGPTEQIIRKA